MSLALRLVSLALVTVLACPSCRTAQEGLGEVAPREESWPGLFIDAEWVAENWGRLTIVDTRSAEAYASGHIHGAIHLAAGSLNHHASIEGEGLLPLPQFEELMASCGIGEKARVVVYSRVGDGSAVRLAWALDVYGHRNVALLVEGIEGWEKAGYPVDSAPRVLPRRSYHSNLQTERIASCMGVMETIMKTGDKILDLRPAAGGTGAARERIPSSVSLDFGAAVMEPASLPAVQKLQELLKPAIQDHRKLVLYGDRGPRVCFAYLALRELGAETSMYIGGWEEWSSNPNLPLEFNKSRSVSQKLSPEEIMTPDSL